MSQFRQKPSRLRKGHSAPGKQPVRRTRRSQVTSAPAVGREKPKGRGFSFSVPSPMTLAVIAATVVISLIALNWEGISSRVPDKYLLQPAADGNADRHTMKYAEFGTPAILAPAVSRESAPNDEIEQTINDEIPLEIMDKFEWSHYKVLRGDSVSRIAVKFGVSMDAIIASNDIRNARRLREGDTLRIPNIDGIPYQVKRGDSLAKISRTYNVPFEVILDVNDVTSENINEGDVLFIPGARMPSGDLRLALGELFIYPIRKVISSNYGWRKDPFTGEQSFHTGLDLKADTGTTVKAAMDGTVSVIGNSRVYGQHIILSHDNGYKTLYAHLSAYSVKQGDRVTQGRKIGEVGSTGYSTGPHLHFGVFKNGKWVNPLELLN